MQVNSARRRRPCEDRRSRPRKWCGWRGRSSARCSRATGAAIATRCCWRGENDTLERHPELDRSQQEAVRDVFASREKIVGIDGIAGAGKTTTLAVIREGAQARGGLGPMEQVEHLMGVGARHDAGAF